MSSSSPLRGGFIGCGFVSQYHIEAWKLTPRAELVAVCDQDPRRLEGAIARVPEAHPYRDAGAMFAAGRLDFVEIATRPESHRGLVELAAGHGVHILCQKPAAPSRPDLLAMIEACERAGVRLMFHENWRFRPWYRALRLAIDAGAIGRPIRLRIAHRDTRAIRPDGFADQPYLAANPRLILMEMGCHLVDTARFLFGPIERVTASLGRFGDGHPGEDVAMLMVGFRGGALGLLDMSWCAPADVATPEWALNETVAEGTGGTLRLRSDGSLEWIGPDGRVEARPVELPPADRVYLDAYVATQAHFIDGLLQGFEHETHALDTLTTMDVVWAAYQSAETGRTIAF